MSEPFKQVTAYTDDTPVVASNSSHITEQPNTPEQVLSDHHILGVLNQHGLTLKVNSAMSDYGSQFEFRISQLEAKLANFPEFVESTGLSQKDKDLIKGVFYDWKESKI